MKDQRNIQEVLDSALEEGREVLLEGKVASYIPELAKANSGNLGVCITQSTGESYISGDYDIPFTIQSISKAFMLILALQLAGREEVFSKIGMEPTGDRFDSIMQLELTDRKPFNPLINAGAIVTASCILNHTQDPFEAYLRLVRLLCNDSRIRLSETVYQSEKRTGTRNRSIAYLLKGSEILVGEPEDILDLYFKSCSTLVTARNLSHAAMILSNHGKDPISGKQVISSDIIRTVLSLMMLCGMYNESGEYAVKVGLPSKSGVGGGIMAVARGGVGIATFGPALNPKGNSVGGMKILQYLSEHLCLHTLSMRDDATVF